MIGFVLGGIVMAAVGFFLFLKPAVLWRITEQWKSNEADGPSLLYDPFGFGSRYDCVPVYTDVRNSGCRCRSYTVPSKRCMNCQTYKEQPLYFCTAAALFMFDVCYFGWGAAHIKPPPSTRSPS